MRPVLSVLLLALAMTAAAVPEYPESWGEPPSFGTMDYRPLPGGYGHGARVCP